MALNGSLDDYSPAGALRVLASSGKTGAVRFTGEAGCTVYLDRGQLYFARDDHTDHALATALVRADRLSADDWASAISEAGNTPRVGELLVSEGAIDADLLASVVLSIIYDPLIHLFREGDGSFDFEADTVHWIGPFRTFNVDAIVDEVRRRVLEVDKMKALVPSVFASVAANPSLPDHAPQVTLLREDWELVTALGSAQTISDLAGVMGRGRYSTARVVHRLALAGLVTVARESSTDTDEAPVPDSFADTESLVETEAPVEAASLVDAEPVVEAEPLVEQQPEIEDETVVEPEAEPALDDVEAFDPSEIAKPPSPEGFPDWSDPNAWGDINSLTGGGNGAADSDPATDDSSGFEAPDDPRELDGILEDDWSPRGPETVSPEAGNWDTGGDSENPQESGWGLPRRQPAALHDGDGGAQRPAPWHESEDLPADDPAGEGIPGLEGIGGFRDAIAPQTNEEAKPKLHPNAAWLENLYAQYMDEPEAPTKKHKKEAIDVAFAAEEQDGQAKVGTLRRLMDALKKL